MDLLFDGPEGASPTVLLAHGAGAPMDSPFMEAVATALGSRGLRVARFEFAYMAGRGSGRRAPPPRAEALVPEYRIAVAAVDARGPLFIGGKSLGGRVASLVADELHGAGAVAGLLCLGYPFHPEGKPTRLRTAHLETLATPALICQGTRDPFGSREEVAAMPLSPAIELFWLEDGDHGFSPRKLSGLTLDDHVAKVAQTVASWACRVG